MKSFVSASLLALASAQMEGFEQYQRFEFVALSDANPDQISTGYQMAGAIETHIAIGAKDSEMVVTLDLEIPSTPLDGYTYQIYMQVADWDDKTVSGFGVDTVTSY
jgi:hypothetical protein